MMDTNNDSDYDNDNGPPSAGPRGCTAGAQILNCRSAALQDYDHSEGQVLLTLFLCSCSPKPHDPVTVHSLFMDKNHNSNIQRRYSLLAVAMRFLCVTDTRAHVHTPIVHQDSRK